MSAVIRSERDVDLVMAALHSACATEAQWQALGYVFLWAQGDRTDAPVTQNILHGPRERFDIESEMRVINRRQSERLSRGKRETANDAREIIVYQILGWLIGTDDSLPGLLGLELAPTRVA
jgi:hypothetical protein